MVIDSFCQAIKYAGNYSDFMEIFHVQFAAMAARRPLS